MRKETTVRCLYTFDELPDSAKQKAVDSLWDLNVDYDWWELTYDELTEAGQAIGIGSTRIKGFDLDRGQSIYIEADRLWFSEFIKASKKWGKLQTEWPGLYEKLNLAYYQKELATFSKWFLKIVPDTDTATGCYSYSRHDCKGSYETHLYGYGNLEEQAEKAGELMAEFLEDFRDYCWKTLRDEYEWRLSEEQVIETIQSNRYEFTKDGKLA